MSTAETLQKNLLINHQNAGLKLSDEDLKLADNYCEEYKNFLNKSKTERLAVKYTISQLVKHGFSEFSPENKYIAGDKIFINNRNKSIIAAIIGKESLENGVKIIASHIDSPRIDLKPRPLYEQAELAYFRSHYYGGIKKYQWTSIPLSLIGVIVKKDGTTIEVNIGEDPTDPVFCINDLLPHLAKDQMQKSMSEGISGEQLSILIGSRPYRTTDKVSEKVKLNIINILNEKYGITEYDFLSSELTVVPNFSARDIGFDKSIIGSYGQDDRVSAYTSLTALINVDINNPPKYTSVCVLADKEEIGSEGNTGLKSAFLKYFIADLAKPHGIEGRTVLSKSKCLSADVNVGFDPNFEEVTEKRNTAYINYGVVVTKYVGARGKSGTSDANAEFVGEIRTILDNNNIIWQTGELGKVDQGGGGTVAAYIANLNVDVVDIGIPILSMHSPFETASKFDIYMAYKAFKAFYTA